MIERVVEYLANALWQLPLLAVGAWWLLRAARLGPLAQHRVWVAVLGLGVVLPLARVAPRAVVVRPVVMTHVVDVDARTMVDMPLRTVGEGSRSSWIDEILQRRSIEVSAGVARGLAGVYVLLLLLGLVRIGRAWGAARRLVVRAEDAALGEGLGSLLAECGRSVGVGLPRVVESCEVSSPAVVGQVLVLPEGFAGYSEDEMRAALLHELAHLRRRDFGSNLVCEIAGLPVVWHPASYAVRGRIRSTREMVCDGIAAGAMGSATVYARSLVGLAARACTGGMEAQPMAVGLFTNNNLEERVMQLMETKQTMMARVSMVRVMSAAAGMVALVGLATMVHVTPAMAQQAAPAPAAQAVSDARGAHATSTPKPIASGQSVPPEDGAVAGSTSTGAGASSGEGASSSEEGQVSSAEGPMGSSGLAEELHDGVAPAEDLKGGLTSASVLDNVDKDCPMGPGTHAHHWITSEGKDFSVINCDAQEPTEEQKKAMEKKFHEQMVDLQKQVAKLKTDELRLDSTETKRQMADARKQLAQAAAQMNSLELRKQMANARKQLAQAAEQLNSLELRKQMAELRSPDFQKQMEDLRREIASSRLNSPSTQKELSFPDSAELKQQMAELNGELSTLVNKEVQQQIREQMESARKQIDEARKLMKQEQLKEHPEANCLGDCAVAPK